MIARPLLRTLAVALLLAHTPATRAAPPAPGSDDAVTMQGSEEWITRQRSPNGGSCCDLSDGRPVSQDEIRRTPTGGWEVLYTKKHWPNGNETWLPVPDNAVLHDPSPLGMPIAWVYYGRVLCLALAPQV